MAVPRSPQKVVARNLLLSSSGVAVVWEGINGVSGFNIYRNMVPYGSFEKINTTMLLPGMTGYVDTEYPIIQETEPYYSVTCLNKDGESQLSPPITYDPLDNFQRDPFKGYPDSPSLQVTAPAGNLPSNLQMRYFFLEIRRRNLWLLEQNGSEVWLFKRKWPNQTPMTEEELDSRDQYERKGQYFEPIKIKVRLVSAVQSKNLVEYGLRREKIPRSWSIWTPRIHDHDIIVDSQNRRYEIVNVTAHYFRDLITHFDFETRLLEITDAAYNDIKFDGPTPLRPLPVDTSIKEVLP